MKPQHLAAIAVSAAAGAAVVIAFRPPDADAAASGAQPASDAVVAPRAWGRLPRAFEENRGQADARARFLVRAPGMTAFLCPTEAVFALHSSVPQGPPGGDPAAADAEPRTEAVRMRFVGASESAKVEARDALPGRCSYFVGNDPSRWVTDVPTCARVVQRDVWPGVDLGWRGDERGRLAYDLVLAPGADVAAVAFEFEGARARTVEPDGSLRIAADLGELRHTRPVAFQVVDGTRREVDAAFAVAEDGRVGFTVGAHDAGRPLVIDPSLTYSTYLGGSSTTGGASEIGYSIAVDASGAAYVAGATPSASFPTQSAFQGSLPATISGFVSKIDASGSALVWSTYLGGTTSSPNRARAIALDASGAAYVTGETFATDFPTQGALQPANAGGKDVFVTKLAPSGSSLSWSTYLGGSGSEEGLAIAVDGSGAAYVAGITVSSNFPLQSALQTAHGGGQEDAFVAKINAAGSALAYSTYLGGSGVDRGYGIAVDSTGNACVVGDTQSTSFPTQSPLQGTHAGGNFDAFVAKLNAGGSALAWSTYFGGSASDYVRGVAVDATGAVYIAGFSDPNISGYSPSNDLPTASAFQATRAGRTDAFVAKIGSSGSALAYSTFLGGSSAQDVCTGVAVDSGGAASVVGSSWSTDFPTASPSQPSYGGGAWDAFVAKVGASGSTLVFSTYLGGSGSDEGKGIATDSTGAAYVTGYSSSSDFPLQSALQATYGGGASDAFVAKYPLGTGGGSTTPVPAAPTSLVATYPVGGGVSLTWTDASSDETGFRVERKPQGYAFAVLATTAANTTSLVDGLLYPNTTYTYRVRAFNAGGGSAWSNEASITTDGRPPVPAPPLAPTQLAAEVLEDGTVWLSWTDRSADEVGFNLERSEGGAAFARLAFPRTDVAFHVDDTVRPGWPNAYRVAAVSLQGPSPWSNTATASVPATLDLAVTSGKLVDSKRSRRDSIQFAATWAFVTGHGVPAFDPVADGVELRLGFTSAPVAVSIPPGDAGWKVRTRKPRGGGPASVVRATWKSPKGATPKVAVTVDFVRNVVTASVSGLDLAPRVGDAPPVRVLVACGAAGGAHSADWTEVKAGFFRFKAK